jgi:hypothetical protein
MSVLGQCFRDLEEMTAHTLKQRAVGDIGGTPWHRCAKGIVDRSMAPHGGEADGHVAGDAARNAPLPTRPSTTIGADYLIGAVDASDEALTAEGA